MKIIKRPKNFFWQKIRIGYLKETTVKQLNSEKKNTTLEIIYMKIFEYNLLFKNKIFRITK